MWTNVKAKQGNSYTFQIFHKLLLWKMGQILGIKHLC